VEGRTKYWCTEVTLDISREELRKAAEDLYDLTGGSITLDPAAVDETAMTHVMKEVTSLTMKERTRRKVAIKEALSGLKSAASAQITFLMDCTESMGAYIKAAKEGIEAIQMQIISSAPKGSKLTCAFVGYRDFGDSPVPTFPFSSDVKAFKDHLHDVHSSGGGDECEDVLGGLNATNKLAWDTQIPTKILFHIADAPCHGRFFARTSSYNDSHLNIDMTGAETKDVLQNLCSTQGIQYIFLRINSRTTDMITVYNELLKTLPMSPQITTHALNEAGDIMKFAVSSTVASISAHYSKASASAGGSTGAYIASVRKVVHDAVSMTKSRRSPSSLIPSLLAVKEEDEDGASSSSEIDKLSSVGNEVEGKDNAKYVEVCSLVFPESITDLKKPMKMTEIHKRHFELDDSKEFDKGACRKVSRALDVTFPDHIPYVLKLHILSEDPETEKCNAIGDLQGQAVAAYLAQTFSALDVIKSAGKSVVYLKSKLIKLKAHDGKIRYGSIERILEGGFVKWCNNGHYQKGAADPDFSATLAAFTHWTHSITDGYLMVVDVQGIRAEDGKKFVLTDPAVHCVATEKFGMLNLGKDGMDSFWSAHGCNEVCKALHLSKRGEAKSIKVGTLAV
jgi:hypothetical protein